MDYPEPRVTGPTATTHRSPDGVGAVVMLHGFTQTGACLGPVADLLAESHRLVAPDLPGHGAASAIAATDCPDAAAMLLAVCGAGAWIGYSMGARLSLHAALMRPDLVSELVLIGGTPGIIDPAARATRRGEDRARARHLEAIGVHRFVGEWLAQDLFAGLPPWAAFTDERNSNTVSGLAGSLRRCGTGSMDPLWDRLGGLDMPVLCISGATDARFAAIAADMSAAIGPNASVALVPEAGHAAHLEQPGRIAAIIKSFLQR